MYALSAHNVSFLGIIEDFCDKAKDNNKLWMVELLKVNIKQNIKWSFIV